MQKSLIDLSTLKKNRSARIRFLALVGLVMLSVFTAGNIWLGVSESRPIDDAIRNLSFGMLDRGWTGLEEKYGSETALVVHLLKARIFGFLIIEMILIAVLLGITRLSEPLLSPLPDARKEMKTTADPADLMLIRRFAADDVSPLIQGRGTGVPAAFGHTGFGTRDIFYMFLVFYLLIMLYVVGAPFSVGDGFGLRKLNQEIEVVILLFSASFLIWSTPYFVVTVLRLIMRNRDSR